MVVAPSREVPRTVRQAGLAAMAKSRTSWATKTAVRRSGLATRRPDVAHTRSRSELTVTRTCGLVGVRNGSPWSWEPKRMARLSQGMKRYSWATSPSRAKK